MSKTLDRLIATDERFASYHYEDDGYGFNDTDVDRPSIWLYCAAGYICPERECGSIHTKTVAEAMRQARTVIKGDPA